MKDLTKIYIDLAKCTEKQRKCIVQILNTTGKYILWDIDDAVDFLIHYNNRWCTTDENEDLKGKTELTYPEFIKLFEGGEDYPGKQYQPLFDHLNQEHGLVLHESEMDEIIRIVGGLNSNQ